MGATAEDYRVAVREAVLGEPAFVRAVVALAKDAPWARITIRPVSIRGRRMIQFSYFDGRKTIVQNFGADEASVRLDEALDLSLSHIYVETSVGDLHVRLSRRGRMLVTRTRPSYPAAKPDLAHDHRKHRLLDAATDSFLQAIGIADSRGGIRPSMEAKYRQVNEFVRIVDQTVPQLAADGRLIRIVDCGSGSAYLTLAAYHFLAHTRGLPVRVTGIDVNQEMVEKSNRLAESLGWSDVEFHVSSIIGYQPQTPPDMVLSLHACDTATDEAIANGILWGSRVILAAPCCQHELHDQIRSQLWQPVIRHGVLKERLADILTDSFRALALRIMGYRTRVIEFVSPEYTSKNLLIRAEKGLRAADLRFVREYRELKEFWKVTPAIERLLGPDFVALVGPSGADGGV